MPTLKERIDADLKDAMRAKEELKLGVLRMLKSAVKYKEVEPGADAPLDDAGVMKVLGSMIKQRRDSVAQYEAGGRADLAKKEADEIALLQAYLPEQLSPEDLAKLVTEAISESGAAGPKEMGKAMKVAMAKVAGRAESRAVSAEVKKQLGG